MIVRLYKNEEIKSLTVSWQKQYLPVRNTL